MKKLSIVLFGVLFMLTSCSTSKISMNVQKSLGRSGGDLIATLTLDMKNDKVTPEQVISFAKQISDNISKYNNDTITKEELVSLLEDKISNDTLKPYITKIVKYIPENISLVEKKKIIIAICTGLCVGATEWKPEDNNK